MRTLGFAGAAAVIAFWILMNGLLVRRTLELRSLDRYRRGVIDFLGGRARRERAMGIYFKNRRIGSTRFAIERTGEGSFEASFAMRASGNFFNLNGSVALEGRAGLDARVAPEWLNATLSINDARTAIEGRRDGDSIALTVRTVGGIDLRLRLPRSEQVLTDLFIPSPPIAGLRPGETYRMVLFDPLRLERVIAETRVVGREESRTEGIAVDCMLVETTWNGVTARSWVTTDGVLIREELPSFDIVLKREPTPEEAPR